MAQAPSSEAVEPVRRAFPQPQMEAGTGNRLSRSPQRVWPQSRREPGPSPVSLSVSVYLPLLQSSEGEMVGEPRVCTRGCIPCLRWRQKPV